MCRLNFKIEATNPGTSARAGRFTTLHSEVLTPVFMPVGTRATVKGQTIESLKENGAQCLLANTYHLFLRPGAEVFRKFGGIHNFMKWDGSVLTDSGGFQIFSLHKDRKMNEEGAEFKSYLDGQTFLLTPELSIETQKAIGSDIMMVLDQCIPSTASYEEAKAAMELTHRWALRSLAARGDSKQSMFGIVQGACFEDLRKQSAAFLTQQPFDGFAIGGLAVGETPEKCWEFASLAASRLPENLPRYLMGVGTPIDILEAVNGGVDMFDCIMPSQLGHRGTVYTSQGKMQMRRTVYKFADEVLDPKCNCYTCRSYSRAYLHHLIKSGEPLGWFLLTTHNLAFYHRLMREMRQAIFDGKFKEYYNAVRPILLLSDEANPPVPPKRNVVRIARLGDYEIHHSKEGFASIKQTSSGEIMHSVNKPEEEANKLYIEQSELANKILKLPPLPQCNALQPPQSLCDSSPASRGASSCCNDDGKDWIATRPTCNDDGKGWIATQSSIARNDDAKIVVWDVGLGAAHNAMAAVRCFEKVLKENGAEKLNKLKIISFECDLDPLKLACKHNKEFPHLHHSAPFKLLKEGKWSDSTGLLEWKLVEGDYLKLFDKEEKPDIIFYDPFSPKTDCDCWSLESFRRLYEYCKGKSFELYTYTTSTMIRAAMLVSGMWVAKGAATGPKESTTIAFSDKETALNHKSAVKLLDKEWLARWHRSQAQFPKELTDEEKAEFTVKIENHPQFMEY